LDDARGAKASRPRGEHATIPAREPVPWSNRLSRRWLSKNAARRRSWNATAALMLKLPSTSVRISFAGRLPVRGLRRRRGAGVRDFLRMPPTSAPASPSPDDPSSGSLTDLITANYPVLRRMAEARAAASGVSPSSLTHDVVCRLLKLPSPPSSKEALHGVAHQLMEWGLVDRVRQNSRRRRREGEARRRPAARARAGSPSLSLSRHLDDLAAIAPRKAEALLLWAVANLSMKQIARALEVSEKTVQRDLDFAKAWIAAATRRSDA